jgi:phosphoglycolate phosphatase-like HAD superfamily hydrolase
VAQLGLDPGDVVYVGDNPVDVAVGRAAGVEYRHVAWGEPAPADVVRLERFAELVPAG